MQTRTRMLLAAFLLSLTGLLLVACGGAATPETGAGEEVAVDSEEDPGEDVAVGSDVAPGDATTVRYWLWDANQLPAYQACAAAFTEENPNIVIEIEQLGWDDYWSGLQTGFVSGTAPDVFTNHLAKYPEFVQTGQIVDIQPLVERDQVPTDIYIGELAELWTVDGARYGLPKDWDTVAVIYNQAMLEEAGIDPAIMEEWTWNPEDGGTFTEAIAALTVDENGNNGLSPDFDPENVEQYGFIPQGSGGAYGQTQWSSFAVSNGFQFLDELWADNYHYEDPALAETLDWYSGLHLDHGFAPPLEEQTSLGGGALFAAGEGALTTDGSWLINWYADNTDFEIGFGLPPIGPEGRKSMFNGLADSIWTGSQNQEAAWEWVKFLGSPDCQNIVGSYAVVFPAIQSGTDAALEAFAEKGLDVSPFIELATDPDATFLFPITENASEVVAIMTPVMDSIMLGEVEPAEALPEADAAVDAALQ